MHEPTPRNCWGLVLAGGDGKRLQPLTRAITGVPLPKQYCRLLDNRSMLELTLARSHRAFSPERTLVVVNQDHLAYGRDQLCTLPATNVVVQPCNRDTGPGIVFALLQLARRDPSATVALLPSDHYVGDDRAFMSHVARGARLVAQYPEQLVMLGVRPERAEPGYGYIVPGQPLSGDAVARKAFRVATFVEKPSADVAKKLGASGGLWNCFVMIFRVARLFELLGTVAPAELAHLLRLRHDVGAAEEVYRSLAPWNFSSRVLARIPEHLIVLQVDDVYWNDWGTPESIEQTLRLLDRKPPWRVHPASSAGVHAGRGRRTA